MSAILSFYRFGSGFLVWASCWGAGVFVSLLASSGSPSSVVSVLMSVQGLRKTSTRFGC